MNATVADSKLDKAINEAFRRLRDVSLRDGVQSWDGNKWPIDEIVPVAKEFNELVKLGKKRGIDMPPAEVWGGGQVVQPAMFLGEDPLRNAEDLHRAMPDVDMQLLYRGRQGFGFAPISVEIQEKAIEAAASRGVKVFRIFDMMNDIENVKPGFAAMNAYKDKHGKDSIVVEGAISYISPPEKDGIAKGQRAMTLKEYGEYAVDLAKLGSDEIVIKNYAGVGDKEMPDLIKAIRTELDKAGYMNMKINLHDHGQKPDVVADAIKAGADKVDVAIGNLSGGPSHTNMRTTIYHLLEEQGFDTSSAATQTAINHNPMMKQLKKVEDAIDAVVAKERPGKNGQATTFKAGRAVLEAVTQEDADRIRVAGGAFSALLAEVERNYDVHKKAYDRSSKASRGGAEFPDKQKLFQMALENCPELWEKAGQFNTVTPGAKILTEQALVVTLAKINGQKINPETYSKEYVDIAAGRFGRNRGMEKGLGDTKWLDSMLMYRALKTMNNELVNKRISDKQLVDFVLDAGLGVEPLGYKHNLGDEASKGRIGTILGQTNEGKVKIFNLHNDDNLMAKLNVSSIDSFRRAIEKSSMDDGVKARVSEELRKGRYAEPTAGMAEGYKKIEAYKANGKDVAALHASGHRISNPEDMALMSMVLPDAVFNNVIETVAKAGPVAAAGEGADAGKSHLAGVRARAAGETGKRLH